MENAKRKPPELRIVPSEESDSPESDSAQKRPLTKEEIDEAWRKADEDMRTRDFDF